MLLVRQCFGAINMRSGGKEGGGIIDLISGSPKNNRAKTSSARGLSFSGNKSLGLKNVIQSLTGKKGGWGSGGKDRKLP